MNVSSVLYGSRRLKRIRRVNNAFSLTIVKVTVTSKKSLLIAASNHLRYERKGPWRRLKGMRLLCMCDQVTGLQ